MNTFEDEVRTLMQSDPVEVPLDLDAVLDGGRESVRGRRLGWTVAGMAALAVVASIVTPLLIAQVVPAVPAPAVTPAATATASATAAPTFGVEGWTWTLTAESGEWADHGGATFFVEDSRVSGQTGCGSYTARLERSGDRWTIRNLKSRPLMCPLQVGRFSNRYLSTLQAITSGAVGQDWLRLESPEGALVFARPR